jgi:hypothetical protein
MGGYGTILRLCDEWISGGSMVAGESSDSQMSSEKRIWSEKNSGSDGVM